MKLHQLYASVAYQSASHSILSSTISRTTFLKSQACVARSLSTTQWRNTPQAATQEAESSDTPSEVPESKPSRYTAKRVALPNTPSAKPSTRQTPSARYSYTDTIIPSSPWGTPQGVPQGLPPRRQVSAKESAYRGQIADLMDSMTRAPERKNTSRTSGIGSASTTFGAPRTQPLTPLARKQDNVANILSNTIMGGIHARLEPMPPMRIDPFMGRAVAVDRNKMPFSRALGRLQRILSANKVQYQARQQKFFERRGLKKKRLKSERWRKRFMGGFRHMVEKVRGMKAQGW